MLKVKWINTDMVCHLTSKGPPPQKKTQKAPVMLQTQGNREGTMEKGKNEVLNTESKWREGAFTLLRRFRQKHLG